MVLVSLAIDYKKAPIEVRSGFAINHNDVSYLYSSIKKIQGIKNVVFLSTCNRTEIYLNITNLSKIDDIISWWQENSKTNTYNLKDYFILRQGTEVVKHLMKLACGLESMVLGEPQILGQVKYSYNISKEKKSLGKELDRIFQKVFATAKKVRNDTKIGHCPVSVAFSSIVLAKQQLDNITEKNVLIIGAGETGTLLFRHINSLKPQNIFVANRSIEKAKMLISDIPNTSAYTLDNLSYILNKSDIVIAAVNFNDYLINIDCFNHDTKKVFIDLSIPQVINPKIKELENSVYYCVDDVNTVIENGRKSRLKESKKAEKIIIKSLEEHILKEKAIISNKAIKQLFDNTDKIIDSSLDKSLNKLKNGKDAEDVLKRFAYDIKKKVLHYPIKGIKEASENGRDDFLTYMKDMFGLENGK